MEMKAVPTLADLGKEGGDVSVTIGARFLELFSSNLYTSPNKAFEELVSNAWDAKARSTYIGVPSNLRDADAVLWVLDNGTSMDLAGLQLLWSVGESHKRDNVPSEEDSDQIGKFGIGKLATYLLANRLTFICKALDGVVRLVEMNYAAIDQPNKPQKNLLRPTSAKALKLKVKVLKESDLEELFSRLGTAGKTIRDLVKRTVPTPAPDQSYVDEFGGPSTKRSSRQSKTWTLAVMTDLKDVGKKIQPGRLRLMLEAALPLGRTMAIVYNGQRLVPRLATSDILHKTTIGPDLKIPEITIEIDLGDRNVEDFPDTDDFGGSKRVLGDRLFYDYPIHTFSEPYPYVQIGNLPGKITGQFSVYKDEITGRKSEEHGRSHGYFINVKGRVINVDDAYFGLKNLNHTAWAHFRATVRADWLDRQLTVNRESIHASVGEVELFRMFLRALFNRARKEFDAPMLEPKPIGPQLAGSWGAIPLQSFRSAISRFASNPEKLPPEIRLDGVIDVAKELAALKDESAHDVGALLQGVKFTSLGAAQLLFGYEVRTRTVIINVDHPFVQEYAGKRETKNLLESAAVAEVLSDAHLAHLGVAAEDIGDYQRYRDDMLRVIVKLTRRSAATIAKQLLDSTSDDDALEEATTEALQALGFDARNIRGSGKTDGIAISPTAKSLASSERAYKFTYDAKSSKSGKARTQDLKVEKLRLHREQEGADYTLIVAPDFEDGQIKELCRSAQCTPMRAHTLVRLLLLVARFGSIDLEKIESVFERHHPDDVDAYVADFAKSYQEAPLPSLSTILGVLSAEGFGRGAPFSAKVIHELLLRQGLVSSQSSWHRIFDLFKGLAVLVPGTVRVSSTDEIWFATSRDLVLKAVSHQIEELPEEFRPRMESVLQEKAATSALVLPLRRQSGEKRAKLKSG